MFPGMRGMNPQKLKQMMKQMGIDIKEIEGVEEVIIRTADSEIVFRDADVTIMDARGVKTYQIAGTPEEHPREEIPEADVQLVIEQTGVSETEAKAALKEVKGDLAEAIMNLKK
ncbi:MAG: nascent polypeptide-associated complex protein [Methanocellales archaeon]|nr:nascent polypeptide-associated complex protein [Methanocellales archaeon]MDD3291057.1 nascent polypeptide-associated complex protein [Methanocellales archaeon]MDD5234942.1 nascent polypeptide-associated complex protein [Methanocellales archaeon]MDD5484688.1 nascent polypeptide-associated complex protein [Methanocellales archaeon]